MKEHTASNFKKQEGETAALLGRYLNLYQVTGVWRGCSHLLGARHWRRVAVCHSWDRGAGGGQERAPPACARTDRAAGQHSMQRAKESCEAFTDNRHTKCTF